MKLISFLLAVVSAQVLAAPKRVPSILPENKLRVSIFSDQTSNVTEEQFERLLKNFEILYKPVFASTGKTFTVVSQWSNDSVNAYADLNGTAAKVVIFGGIARHPRSSLDGVAAVLCHEIGHHLAGAPKYPSFNGFPWASNEGQSDYFTTLKCLRNYFRHDFHFVDVSAPTAIEECQKSWESAVDQNICMRSVNAGIALASVLADAGRDPIPRLDTPDQTVVSRTNNGHPRAQCRLDTFFRGALCTVADNVSVDDVDPNKGTCNTQNGAPLIHHRPLCWYKP